MDDLIEKIVKAIDDLRPDGLKAYKPQYARAMLDAITASGFVIMPVEPTIEMELATSTFGSSKNNYEFWKAMLAARPGNVKQEK